MRNAAFSFFTKELDFDRFETTEITIQISKTYSRVFSFISSPKFSFFILNSCCKILTITSTPSRFNINSQNFDFINSSIS